MSRRNRETKADRARRLEGRFRKLQGQCRQSAALQLLCEEARRRGRCLICGGRSSDVHIWSPGPELSGRFLVPAGQARVFPFCACQACLDHPGAMGRVRDAMVAAWGRMTHAAGASAT